MNSYKLKDIVSFQNGFAFNSNDMGSKGTNIIKIKEVKNNRIVISSSTQKTENYNINELYKYNVKYNDILIALTGDPINKGNTESWVGRTAIYRENDIALLNQRMCKIIPNENYILNKYLYYYLISFRTLYKLAVSAKGSANQANISHNDVGELNIYLPSLEDQQHIVDIIGSIDDKIENNNKIIDKTIKLGKLKYKNISNNFENINNYIKFEKGREASSSNYKEVCGENDVHYIRVKDLNSISDTYVSLDLNLPTAADKDILISFDGAVGRVNFGLVGAYSSGIYKVKLINTDDYGIFYWALIDDKNQNIMLEHTNGTTILHASKSKQYLLIKKHYDFNSKYFNMLFDNILNLKRQNKKLLELKDLYLKKFFS